MASVSLHCPNCHRIDGVQKVSAIVAAGTSADTYTGYSDGVGYSPSGPVIMDDYITINASRQTTLSRLLSPPTLPSARSFFSTPEGGQATAYLIVMLLFGLGAGFFEFSMIANDPTSILSFTSLVLGGIAIFCCGFPVRIFLRINRIANQAQSLVPHWQRAMQNWQRLYYCHRCDGVFMPGQLFLIPIDQMMDFLYHF